jgi:NADPH:quinone reductase
MDIPEVMKAVMLEKAGGPFKVQSVSMPVPGKGEVLIKISAAPVNPSDLNRINTVSDEEIDSFVPGIEGSGTVIAAGPGLLPGLWMSKRVACSHSRVSSGTWAEYLVTSAAHCFPLSKSISDEQGSMHLVNPMTAVAFFDVIARDHHKAVVNCAAAGALGGMIRILGKRYNIPVINTVRSHKQAEMLKAEGAAYVLVSSDEDFPDRLRALSRELSATLALDPVSGAFTQQLLVGLPYGSTIILYGNLSGGQEGILLRPVLLENKKIHGFYLVNWMKDTSFLKTVKNLYRVKGLIEKDINVTIQGRFKLEETQLAIDTYLNNMSAGKVLLIP